MISKAALHTLAYAFGCYIVALLFHGYTHGGSDQIEILPILKYWSDQSLYPSDFHVQFFAHKGFTERTPFLLFLNTFAGHGPTGILIWHGISSVGLFWALIKLARLVTGRTSLAILAVISIIVLGPRTSLGGNEVYYAYLIPSLPAKALAAWSILLYLKDRWTLSFSLLCLATFFQPLVGVQMFLLLSLTSLWDKNKWVVYSKSALAYTPALIFVGVLMSFQTQGSLPSSEYFDILEFRVPHHFFPSHFDVKDFIVFGAMMSIGLPFFYKANHRIFRIIGFILLGGLVYTVFTEFYPSMTVLNTQWFKTTLWAEAFAVMATWALVGNAIRMEAERFTPLILGLFIIGAVALRWTQLVNAPFFTTSNPLESKVANWAKTNTNVEDVFLLPTTFTAFKYESERSSYVDYKAMIHHHDYLQQWRNRIADVYGLEVSPDEKQGILRQRMPSWPSKLNATGKDVYLISDEIIMETTLVMVKEIAHDVDTLRVYRLNPSLN